MIIDKSFEFKFNYKLPIITNGESLYVDLHGVKPRILRFTQNEVIPDYWMMGSTLGNIMKSMSKNDIMKKYIQNDYIVIPLKINLCLFVDSQSQYSNKVEIKSQLENNENCVYDFVFYGDSNDGETQHYELEFTEFNSYNDNIRKQLYYHSIIFWDLVKQLSRYSKYGELIRKSIKTITDWYYVYPEYEEYKYMRTILEDDYVPNWITRLPEVCKLEIKNYPPLEDIIDFLEWE